MQFLFQFSSSPFHTSFSLSLTLCLFCRRLIRSFGVAHGSGCAVFCVHISMFFTFEIWPEHAHTHFIYTHSDRYHNRNPLTGQQQQQFWCLFYCFFFFLFSCCLGTTFAQHNSFPQYSLPFHGTSECVMRHSKHSDNVSHMAMARTLAVDVDRTREQM